MQYPMNLEMDGRRCAVLGGGHVALRKARTLLAAGAAVRVIAPAAVEEIAALAAEGAIVWLRQGYARENISDCFLVICATDDEEVNRRAAREAKDMGILVNAPAEPALSDFTVPASLRRGKLLLTVSTGNASPALSRFLRRKLEEEFPPAYGAWLERLEALRGEIRRELSSSGEREAFWRFALNDEIMDLVKQDHREEAEVELRNAIARYRSQS